MSFLKTNNLGSTTKDQLAKVRQMVVEKWDSVGFLDGLKGQTKENMAVLFENQATVLNEATVSDVSGSFETVAFPIVRRVFAKLLANDIVTVQALSLPIGKLFFFLPKISKRGVEEAEGQHPGMSDQLPQCLSTEDCFLAEWENKTLYDMFYNDGIFDHSKGKKTIVTASAVVVDAKKVLNGETVADSEISAVANLALANDNSVRNVVLAVSGFDGQQGKLAFKDLPGVKDGRADGVQMDTESFLASLKVVTESAIEDVDGNVIVPEGGVVPFRLITQKYGRAIVDMGGNQPVCDSEGVMFIELDLTHPVAMDSAETYDGYIGATFEDMPEFAVAFASYDSLEMATEMGEVSFELSEVTVSVEERKLRATWSPELAQDVNAFHNIDAEAELTAILSEQIAAEIDREVLKDLRVAAPWTIRWNHLGWKQTSLASNAYTQKDWNQELITAINQISAQIQKATLRGGANFVVVSTEVSAILNNLEYFHVSDASAESEQYNMGITKAGTIQGRYTVYVDPYSPAQSIIIGHKGNTILNTGYIYAPYVPLQLTPVVTNPHNFAPVKGIATRYAKKVVNNRFYGHITVDNIRTFNMDELR